MCSRNDDEAALDGSESVLAGSGELTPDEPTVDVVGWQTQHTYNTPTGSHNYRAATLCWSVRKPMWCLNLLECLNSMMLKPKSPENICLVIIWWKLCIHLWAAHSTVLNSDIILNVQQNKCTAFRGCKPTPRSSCQYRWLSIPGFPTVCVPTALQAHHCYDWHPGSRCG